MRDKTRNSQKLTRPLKLKVMRVSSEFRVMVGFAVLLNTLEYPPIGIINTTRRHPHHLSSSIPPVSNRTTRRQPHHPSSTSPPVIDRTTFATPRQPCRLSPNPPTSPLVNHLKPGAHCKNRHLRASQMAEALEDGVDVVMEAALLTAVEQGQPLAKKARIAQLTSGNVSRPGSNMVILSKQISTESLAILVPSYQKHFAYYSRSKTRVVQTAPTSKTHVEIGLPISTKNLS
jgi:hypothetical protein